jgi:hypothetical protein
MPNKIQLPPAKSFEEIWAIIHESGQESNEWRKKTERLMKERAAKADKRLKEIEKLMKENGKHFKENKKQF